MDYTINSSQARINLYKLIDDVATSHKPVVITGKRHNAVLVSQDTWQSVEETLYLMSIPQMRESIIEGMKEDINECSDSLGW